MRTSYEVLGIPHGATPSEVRTAYLKRVKVLHPDRFDKETQSIEWQMANDMLQELNEAYADLHSRTQEQSQSNGYSSSGQANDQHERPQPKQTSSQDGNTKVDERKTLNYWKQLWALYSQSTQEWENLIPLNWSLSDDRFDKQMNEWNNSIRITFETELLLQTLDSWNVDPIAINAGTICRNAQVAFSKQLTERILLGTKAQEIKATVAQYNEAYKSFGKAISIGFGLFDPEDNSKRFGAARDEWKIIHPQLTDMGVQLAGIDRTLRNDMQAIAIQLVAKYNAAFQV